MTNSKWTKNGWRSYPIKQQPVWSDARACEDTLKRLSNLPALVFAGESRALKKHLAEVLEGRAFVLQAGDCAEDFSRCTGPRIHDLLKVILQMSIILAYAGEKKVVKIGRLAGQYAKPRSSNIERVGNQDIPSYRGDMVNSPEQTQAARKPDPRRMLEGYFRSTATLNLARAFTLGGFAALNQVHKWNEASFGSFPANRKYERLVERIRKAINFVSTLGLDVQTPHLNQVDLYTSHEALLLEYEEAMTRVDTTTGDWYDTSAHMLWIGDRTRQPEGAHVEFLSGVCNPLGMKIGPKHKIDDIKRTIQRLNPGNEPGRLTLITRFGAKKVDSLLPPLVNQISKEGFKVVWICDPMHGNTYKNENSIKTRKFSDITSEIHSFFQIHQAAGTVPGGVHLELTGEDVTECIGGSRQLSDRDLQLNYQTNCDPRLNAEQAVELAFDLAEFLSNDSV